MHDPFRHATALRIDTLRARVAKDLDTLRYEVERIRAAITDLRMLDELEREAYESPTPIDTSAAVAVRMQCWKGLVDPDTLRSAVDTLRHALRARESI